MNEEHITEEVVAAAAIKADGKYLLFQEGTWILEAISAVKSWK